MIHFIKTSLGQYHRIVLENILYIDVDLDYCTITSVNKNTCCTYRLNVTISELTNKLNSLNPDIIRVHRSHSINIKNIDYISSSQSLTINNRDIPISNMYRNNLENRINIL